MLLLLLLFYFFIINKPLRSYLIIGSRSFYLFVMELISCDVVELSDDTRCSRKRGNGARYAICFEKGCPREGDHVGYVV